MSRAAHLLRTYGITEAQYESLLEAQSGGCAVCLRKATEFKTRLCVDHDHKTGELRGLLCHYCNLRVVGRHRDPELLHRAANYISQGTGLFVPIRPKKPRKRKKIK